MKKKINAFTLIELIIVISIIAIISSSGIVYFTDFSDDLKIKNSVSEIKGDLDSLDNKVDKREIFDYELTFSLGNLYYLYSENIFDLNTFLKFDSLDLNSGIGKISFSGATSGTGIIRYYAEQKFQKEGIIKFDGSFTGNLNKYKDYLFNGSFSGEILNNININFFDKERFIKLVNIDTNLTTNLNFINIKNILGKKIFGDNENINKIVLTFENDIGKIESLEIIK